jgi:hypothetical protein
MDMTIAKPKKIYKVNLVSSDTDSWTGSLYNAAYLVDMKSIVKDIADYGKAYKMTFAMKGIEDGNILTTEIYGIHIDMGKAVPITQFTTTNRLYTGILSSDAWFGRGIPYFSTKPDDNDPTYFQDIQNIDRINIRVFSINANTQYVPATSGTTPKHYYLELAFEEV